MYNNGKVGAGIGYVTATDEIWEVLESVVSETINMALHTAITMIPVVNIVIPVSDSSLYAIRICGESCIANTLSLELRSKLALGIIGTYDGSKILQ